MCKLVSLNTSENGIMVADIKKIFLYKNEDKLEMRLLRIHC
ncbi:MAG: hypothetical protein Q4E51_05060 [Lachnospiraceae bacterium]|nr:hypothetical protein [Lachnospiraceae bacterium]